MSSIKDLTEAQFKELLDGCFAKPEKRSQMMEEEIKSLAS
ncbi:MAG: hypothetical protein ISEC1_P1833 [Thiomicrorhabdus sp.]|nr:MAG: hypothetical protein ISEC1_P1833 [Thiomicrorhabdus sp.]